MKEPRNKTLKQKLEEIKRINQLRSELKKHLVKINKEEKSNQS